MEQDMSQCQREKPVVPGKDVVEAKGLYIVELGNEEADIEIGIPFTQGPRPASGKSGFGGKFIDSIHDSFVRHGLQHSLGTKSAPERVEAIRDKFHVLNAPYPGV